ncbi:MAG: carbon-nitrogen hydrolase family protein [Pirellulales bacterium]
MKNRYTAAAVQLHSHEDVESNLDAAKRWAEEAARRSARLVVLPELFNCLARPEVMLRHAEEISGRTRQFMSRLAARLGVTLLAGSICERGLTPAKAHNTSLLFGPDGSLLAQYRKLHLFDVDLPGSVCYRESDWLLPGDEVVAVDTDLGRLGLSICYDIRFPELFQLQRADVLLVASAFTMPTGRDHWEVLLRARAIENQAFVVAANQYGEHTPQLTTLGRSLLADPWGTVLSVAADGEGLALAEIDLDRQAEIRARLPSLKHRRQL